jgi:hypothetical protein
MGPGTRLSLLAAAKIWAKPHLGAGLRCELPLGLRAKWLVPIDEADFPRAGR